MLFDRSAGAESAADGPGSFESTAEPTIPKIFVAEEDGRARRGVAQSLRERGFDVVEAGDGDALWQGLETATADDDNPRPADLVVLSARIPRCSSLELLRRLRRRAHRLPVIVLALRGDERSREEAYRLGASLVVELPVDGAGVAAAVLALLDPPEE